MHINSTMCSIKFRFILSRQLAKSTAYMDKNTVLNKPQLLTVQITLFKAKKTRNNKKLNVKHI